MDKVIKWLSEAYERQGATTFLRKKGGYTIKVCNYHPTMNVNLQELGVFFLEVTGRDGNKNDVICPLDVEEDELFMMVNRIIDFVRIEEPEKPHKIKYGKYPISGVK